jgi:hypothetical protein
MDYNGQAGMDVGEGGIELPEGEDGEIEIPEEPADE